jgi:hypothetical protein
MSQGWKAEVARQFALEWSRHNEVPNDLLDRAQKLFAEARRTGGRCCAILQST